MNKIVVLGDVHGNAPALQKVVEKEGLDKEYAVLGDLHGLLAYPSEVVEIVQGLNATVLSGNHDKALFHKDEGHVNSDELSYFELTHTLDNITGEQKEYVKQLPHMDVVTRSGTRICMTHAMPWPEKASGYDDGNSGVTKKNVIQIGSTVSDDYHWVFHGHNHKQFKQDISKFGHDIKFVSTGSVGYDGEYAVVNVETGDVSLKSIDPQLNKVKDHIKDVIPKDCPSVEKWL
jgi:predicted phosphodiesterase